MKKLLIPFLAAITIATSSFASTASENSGVNEHFTTSFSKAKNVSWKSTENYDKASFQLGTENVDAFYHADGSLIGTSKTMAFDKLPKAALETITTKYTFPEFQLTDCIEFVYADNQKNYYVSFDRKNDSVVLEISKTGSVRIFSKTRK